MGRARPPFTKIQQFLKGTDDQAGKIVVSVRRLGNDGRRVKGSMSRTVTVTNAKVSDVYRTIHMALFGSPD